MKVFVAGGTGAVGRFLVPMLVRAGHAVTATTRRTDGAAWLQSVAATAAVLDAFDAAAVERAMGAAGPDVVIDQLTDLSTGFDAESLRRNARLRVETTPILVAVAERAGARRFVAQSGAWLYAPGPLPHSEDDPLRAPSSDDQVLPGIHVLEDTVRNARLEGIILRYGYLWGPRTANEQPGEEPTVHVAAAARAAVLAMDQGHARIYNVVDDGHLVSNERAKRDLGWDPAERGDPAVG